MVSLGVLKPDGSRATVRVPRITRRRYLAQKYEGRPASGSEVAPGVYYVDLARADDAMWKNVLPKLSASRAVICDLREGASPASFEILAHFIDHEIKSPYWDKPILSLHERKYERTQLSIFPQQPRLSAKLIFIADGGTASAPETVLQYAHAAGLGVVVGEYTGGTNGDVAAFESLNGLRIRFTGLRAVNQDGTVIHGHGIAPDVVVHPTVAGIVAGRDELLEAAVSRSQVP
jgi:C-terminal processing protease CtpA/Prc